MVYKCRGVDQVCLFPVLSQDLELISRPWMQMGENHLKADDCRRFPPPSINQALASRSQCIMFVC